MDTNVVQNNSKNNTLDEPEVDSLKIRIPIYLVDILDESITGHWFLVNDVSLEIDPQVYKEKCYTHEENGIKIRLAIEKQTNQRQEVEEYLVLLINSKILKHKYFEGITKHNIETIYKELISLNKVSFSFDTFLNQSACTDIDFKKDGIFHNLSFILNILSKSAVPSEKKGIGYRLFNKKDNVGIEFSDRRTTSFKNNPFFKIYHKEIELKHHSWSFTKKYLSDIDFTNRCRVEVTVKNKKHFRYLTNSDDTSLNNVLSLSREQKEKIISMATNFHLSRAAHKRKEPKEELTPDKLIIYNAMVYMINNGLFIGRIIDYLLEGLEEKTLISRKRTELENIYNKNIEGSNEDKRSKEIEKMCEFLNLPSED